MKNNPCLNCTAGEWGFCFHLEYGECIHHKNKELFMQKQYTETELKALDFFQLIDLAERLQVENYEHYVQAELVEAILEKQNEMYKETEVTL